MEGKVSRVFAVCKNRTSSGRPTFARLSRSGVSQVGDSVLRFRRPGGLGAGIESFARMSKGLLRMTNVLRPRGCPGCSSVVPAACMFPASRATRLHPRRLDSTIGSEAIGGRSHAVSRPGPPVSPGWSPRYGAGRGFHGHRAGPDRGGMRVLLSHRPGRRGKGPLRTSIPFSPPAAAPRVFSGGLGPGGRGPSRSAAVVLRGRTSCVDLQRCGGREMQDGGPPGRLAEALRTGDQRSRWGGSSAPSPLPVSSGP